MKWMLSVQRDIIGYEPLFDDKGNQVRGRLKPIFDKPINLVGIDEEPYMFDLDILECLLQVKTEKQGLVCVFGDGIKKTDWYKEARGKLSFEG